MISIKKIKKKHNDMEIRLKKFVWNLKTKFKIANSSLENLKIWEKNPMEEGRML